MLPKCRITKWGKMNNLKVSKTGTKTVSCKGRKIQYNVIKEINDLMPVCPGVSVGERDEACGALPLTWGSPPMSHHSLQSAGTLSEDSAEAKAVLSILLIQGHSGCCVHLQAYEHLEYSNSELPASACPNLPCQSGCKHSLFLLCPEFKMEKFTHLQPEVVWSRAFFSKQ